MRKKLISLVVVALAVAGCRANKKGAMPPPAFKAQADSVQTDMGQAVDIDVLANDGDGKVKLLELTTVPKGGSAEMVAIDKKKSIVRYTPRADFAGTDQFTYLASKGKEKSEGLVSVQVMKRSGVRLQAMIDQRELIYIQGGKLWLKHDLGDAPRNVKVNGETMDLTNARTTAQLAPAFPTEGTYKVTIEGLPETWPAAEAAVTQQPTKENGYTTIVTLFDPAAGAHQWDVRIRFDAEQ